MNLHIILHALIILIVLHILIKNIDIHYIIGNLYNMYQNRNNSQYETMTNPLLDNTYEDDSNIGSPDFKDFLNANKQQLIEEVKKNTSNINMKATIFNEKNEYSYKPVLSTITQPGKLSNYYSLSDTPDNYNIPNFGSNVINPAQYYKINNLEQKENYNLSNTSYNNPSMNIAQNNILNPVTTNVYNNNPVSLNEINRESNIQSNNILYKNELPMNGGTFMDNVVGYDEINNDYAVYQ